MKRSHRPGVIEDAAGPVGFVSLSMIFSENRFSLFGIMLYPHQERPKMTEHSLWRFSRALHRAVNERQFTEIEPLIDDDIDWTIHGPVDLFPFFGARRGKAAVLEVIRQIADRVRVHRFDREQIMLGMESASSMLRYSLTMLDTNKPVRVRLAHFAQFREGRLKSLRILVDSYELVEQAIGLPRRMRMVPVSA
jgi:ketosteroid isomerase-like protein